MELRSGPRGGRPLSGIDYDLLAGSQRRAPNQRLGGILASDWVGCGDGICGMGNAVANPLDIG